jgi:hypothetical protein
MSYLARQLLLAVTERVNDTAESLARYISPELRRDLDTFRDQASGYVELIRIGSRASVPRFADCSAVTRSRDRHTCLLAFVRMFLLGGAAGVPKASVGRDCCALSSETPAKDPRAREHSGTLKCRREAALSWWQRAAGIRPSSRQIRFSSCTK